MPVLTYVFGGLAVAAGVTSGVVAANAFSKRSAAEDECAPNCDEERVNEIHNQFVLADVAAGVALASAGLAVVFYFTRPEVEKARPNAAVAPFWGIRKRGTGLELTAGGEF